MQVESIMDLQGTNSPYRSEAYGLLAGLRVAWASPITGNIQLTLQSRNVTSVFQRCEFSGPRLVSSQDCWGEIGWLKQQLGPRFAAQWRRGHAERHGGFVHADDSANHLADGLTDAGYSGLFPGIRWYFENGLWWHVRLGGASVLWRRAIEHPASPSQTPAARVLSLAQ